MKKLSFSALLALSFILFQAPVAHASFFDSPKKSVEDAADAVENVVDQTQ